MTKEETIKELKKGPHTKTDLERVLEEYLAEKLKRDVDRNIVKNLCEMFEKKN